MRKEDRKPEIRVQDKDITLEDGSKVNVLIKKFANIMREEGIPNCIMAWDAEKLRYVFAGAMPEEVGDGTQFTSTELTRFIRFLELCTDFNKENYRFDI